MAFKNLFSPNQATGGHFSKNLTGIFKYGAFSVISYVSTNPYDGKGCTQITLDGTSEQGIVMTPTQFGTTNTFSLSLKFYINTAMNVNMYMGSGYSQNRITVPVQAGFNILKYENHISTTGNNIYLTTSNSGVMYYLGGQFELGPTATSYQFPGIDLTGNSITSNEAVQNIKLNQELKLFAIASGEQVRNITVENIIECLGVPQQEAINNIGLIQTIIADAVESTENVNQLIIWIACELMRCDITMKVPRAVLKVKT